MKLLKKQEISALKASEKKLEIEQGAKLAKKIDELREIASQEEANLAKFREQSIKTVKKEVDDVLHERDLLVDEVRFLKAEKEKALLPPDLKKEWDNFNKQDALLRERETKLIEREALVHEADDRDARSKEHERQTKVFLEEARKSYTEISDLQAKIEREKIENDAKIKSLYSDLQNKEKELKDREFVVEAQIKQIQVDKTLIDGKQKELLETEINLEAKSKELFEKEEKIKESENLTKRYLEEAEKSYSEAKKSENESKKNKEDTDTQISIRISELLEKEKDFAFKQQDLANLRKTLDEERDLLEKEKLHVASQQESLRQAWLSIKKLQK